MNLKNIKNPFIHNLNEKDIEHFTTNFGLNARRIMNGPFIKMCNLFTNANIIKLDQGKSLTDEEYFNNLNGELEPLNENIKSKKNNIVLERYPELDDDSYIFVGNHSCPEDIETILNVIDRNTYLVLGSVESLKYNRDMFLSWLNGMVVFDILKKEERKALLPKMKRILDKKNSILIFPEGSHNNHPNKLINNLFDGPVNLSLTTNKKIVLVTLVKDKENNTAYIDVSNPIDVRNMEAKGNTEKEKVANLTLQLRDKMATSVYHIMERHFETIKRTDYKDIDKHFKDLFINDAFAELPFTSDVFDAEYLTKKTKVDKEYEEVVESLSNLNIKEFILKKQDIDNKNVPKYMREHWETSKHTK